MLTVNDGHVAAVRAILTHDVSGFEEVSERLTAADDEPFAKLLAAAFCDAAERRFGQRWTSADVVRFVAIARGRSVESARIDPRAAEVLIRAALGDRSAIVHVDEQAKQEQIPLLIDLVDDENLTARGLDVFLAKARARADRLLSQRS